MKFKYLSLILLVILLIGVAAGATYFATTRGLLGSRACEGERTFNDSGLGIQLVYPCDWNLTTKTSITRATVTNEQATGPILTGYEISVKQNNNNLLFKKILIPVQGAPMPIGKQNYDYEVLQNKYIRYKAKAETTYTYAKYLPCSEVANAFRASDINATDCASAFFEPFGIQFPTLVTAQVENQETLKIMDEIILAL